MLVKAEVTRTWWARRTMAYRGWRGKGWQGLKSQPSDKHVTLETDHGIQAFGYFFRLVNSSESLPGFDYPLWKILA